jgi:stearoyl-CoA desaturase (Delta-9 desaturase)
MQKKMRLENINWINTSFLILTPIIALALAITHFAQDGFHWQSWALGIVYYFVTGLSITAGYHRLFSHRAYQTHPVVKFLYLCFGAGAVQNSCLKWSSDHRIHHLHVDTPNDPYNINEGFFHAHMGWIMLKETNTKMDNVPDLKADPLVMWQHRNYLLLAVIFGAVVPTIIGYFLGSALGGFALGGIGRLVFVHHCTFFINSLCHYMGAQPYSDTHTARDSGFIALFSYGEGYHNFHHEFQADYRNGIRWWQFDPSKWLIASLASIKLAHKLRVTPEVQILKAKLLMQEKKQKIAETSTLTNLRETIINTYLKWQKMKKDYAQMKHSAPKFQLKSFKEQMRLARLELNMLKVRWEFEIAKLSVLQTTY